MLINQYYPAELSRVANYHHGYTPTYIPAGVPRTTFANPIPKPTYYYQPAVSMPPYGVPGSQVSPLVIINNTTCHEPSFIAPPTTYTSRSAPIPEPDAPSYTFVRRVVGGYQVPGRSPPKFECSLGLNSSSEEFPSQPLPILSPPTPPPPPFSAAAALGENGLNARPRTRSSRSRPARPWTLSTDNREPLRRPPTPYHAPNNLEAQSGDGVASISASSPESIDSDPGAAQRRLETLRNTLRNSVRTSH
ncbi:hypothetical protein PENSPDRAFT_755775 [Peniophora sp. CONT]|nr:hypothetical protein PENSPDRAFT_755775 [Peniophora sp. CONT]